MRVECDIEYGETEGDYSEVPCTYATCSRCGYETMAYGDGERSVKRCLVAMRQECPEGRRHFYVERAGVAT